MAVTDEYEVALFQLQDAMKAYFDAAGLLVEVDYGRRAIGRQVNTGAWGRVVILFADSGSYTGPKKMGSKSDDTVQRNAYVLEADCEAHLWAWDDTAPEDDRKQDAAWFRLHEYTLAAMRSYAAVRGRPERLGPAGGPVELRNGVARVVQFVLDVPVHRSPEDQPKLTATATATMAVQRPQGADEDGEAIPPIKSEVGSFESP